MSFVQLDQAVLGRTGAMNCSAVATDSIVQLGHFLWLGLASAR
jgi:hypothetical protein